MADSDTREPLLRPRDPGYTDALRIEQWRDEYGACWGCGTLDEWHSTNCPALVPGNPPPSDRSR